MRGLFSIALPYRIVLFFNILFIIYVPSFAADSDIDFVDLNRTPRGDPIYALNEQTCSIAGVRINSLHQNITDPRVRLEVRKALERLTLHVAYTKERGCKWENSE